MLTEKKKKRLYLMLLWCVWEKDKDYSWGRAFQIQSVVSFYGMRLYVYNFDCLVHATNVYCPGELVSWGPSLDQERINEVGLWKEQTVSSNSWWVTVHPCHGGEEAEGAWQGKDSATELMMWEQVELSMEVKILLATRGKMRIRVCCSMRATGF